MLWLNVRLPYLPLELHARGVLGEEPAAVIERTRRGDCVLIMNPAARRAKLFPAMPLNAALALVPSLRYWHYDATAEQAALQRLAGWAGRYSPQISLDPPRSLLLQIGPSLKLFGGVEALCASLRAGLRDIGYRPVLAAAPFPAAARALARGGVEQYLTEPAHLSHCLDRLPIHVLELEQSSLLGLRELGMHSLQQLFALPGDGLNSRFGPNLQEQLDKLRGLHPDPVEPYRPPLRYRARLELPASVENAESLLFACNRLLKEFAGVLIAQSRGVQRFSVLLQHEKIKPSRLRIGLLRPNNNAEHWRGLVRTQLEQLALKHPVSAIEIRAREMEVIHTESDDLLNLFDSTDAWPGRGEDAARLIERLQARFGPNAIKGLTEQQDHRPEHAYRWVALSLASAGRSAAKRLPVRPLWLYSQPRALAATPSADWSLTELERIENGWWEGDDTDVSRDYYLAEKASGERLWIFRDRRSGGWFVQGLFA